METDNVCRCFASGRFQAEHFLLRTVPILHIQKLRLTRMKQFS